MMPTHDTHPMRLFSDWLNEASRQPQITEPTAMTLSTVDANGVPHSRIVLCKDHDDQSLTFYTNYNSRKGRDIDQNASVSLVFYWGPLARQINVLGTAKRVDRKTSENYWKSRARESQISGYLSDQSKPVPPDTDLQALWQKTQEEFAGKEIPCPENWGGYKITVSEIEFWLGRSGRLHDRYLYKKSNTDWTFTLLFP